ncbi:MAG: hypothetical protein AAF431_07020 [Pseudomonadota bacterium]
MNEDNFWSSWMGPWVGAITVLIAILLLWAAHKFGEAYKNQITSLDSATIESLNRINAMKKCIETSTTAVKAYVAIDDIAYSREDLVLRREIEDQLLAVIQTDASSDRADTKKQDAYVRELQGIEQKLQKLKSAMDLADSPTNSDNKGGSSEIAEFFPRQTIKQRLKTGIETCIRAANPEPQEKKS